MGCGASTPPASHHRMTPSQHRMPLSQLIPAFDQINVPSRQHADSCQDQGAADPDAARYQASAFKDEHEERGPVVQAISTRSLCQPVEDESGEDDKDPWSSWRSYCRILALWFRVHTAGRIAQELLPCHQIAAYMKSILGGWMIFAGR
ncbi:unnamed protein product [Symbiodinium natans]|uniref:Uncharacterized protein n=1 Tax=Symbiodinium natans TaxID=878477 RepID=A0A812U235_9DINO|nr:unnamed protein product [Symbiodinium natans]